MQYNQRLKELRKENKLKQEEVATILDITQSAYSQIEKGKKNLTQQNIIILCKTYNITADYILCLTDEKRKIK